MVAQSWIFQALPKLFDVEGYLATNPGEFLWLVTRSGDRMQVGDTVFLWRAVGDGPKDRSGIVAEAEVTETPIEQPDDASARPFWREGDPDLPQLRVRLRLVRSANRREAIQRSWLKDDPVLRDLTIMKAAAGTNFLLPQHHAERLKALWSRAGRDWDYPDAVAGLWAYQRTYGGEVSIRPGSPVSEIAVLTGRSVGGAYNTVMNFRHLDPRDPRAGLSGAAASDQRVWEKFYDSDARVVREQELELEFKALWPGEAASGPPTDDATLTLDREVAKLGALSMAELMARYDRRHTSGRGSGLPRSTTERTRRYAREALVVAIAKSRASCRCEVPGCAHPTFEAASGEPYVEVHHIVPLEDGGSDEITNVACLCPAHHREVHYGRNAAELTAQLKALRATETNLVLSIPVPTATPP